MGGRGSSLGGRIPEDKRYWSNEPAKPGLPTSIDGVKIIWKKDAGNAKAPNESNSPNTNYFVADRQGKLHYYVEYKNHMKVREIDISDKEGDHYHYFDSEQKRKRHDKGNSIPLTSETDMSIARAMREYNEKHKDKWK